MSECESESEWVCVRVCVCATDLGAWTQDGKDGLVVTIPRLAYMHGNERVRMR